MATVNEHAEQYILGCILMDDSLMDECTLQSEHFAVGTHQMIFDAMKSLDAKGNKIDMFSVSEKSNVDFRYLSDLVSSIPTAKHFQNNQKIILDCWKLRTAEHIAVELRDEISTGADVSVLPHIIGRLSQVDEVGTEETFNIEDVLQDIFDDAQIDQGELLGIDTGWKYVNALTHGWKDEELHIVGARPSVGKTVFALNTAMAACKTGAVVSFFTLEMSDKQLLKRIISSYKDIDATHMTNPAKFFKDSPESWIKLSDAISDIGKMPLFIFDKSFVTVQDIRTSVRKLRQKFPNRKHICIIDYLQLIQVPKKQNRSIEIGDISRSLKTMAREYQMPVIALSQLNRDSTSKADKRPTMSDLKESGSIEQDADVIVLLHREDYFDPETDKKNVIEIIIDKNRNGERGKVELVFLKQFNKFVDLARY